MIAAYTLCPHCNREFQIRFEEGWNQQYATIQFCPHCKAPIHLWLRVPNPALTEKVPTPGRKAYADRRMEPREITDSERLSALIRMDKVDLNYTDYADAIRLIDVEVEWLRGEDAEAKAARQPRDP